MTPLPTFQQAYAALPDHAARVEFLTRHVAAFEARVATALALLCGGEACAIAGPSVDSERLWRGFDVDLSRETTVRVGSFEIHDTWYADLACAFDDPVAARAGVLQRELARRWQRAHGAAVTGSDVTEASDVVSDDEASEELEMIDHE